MSDTSDATTPASTATPVTLGRLAPEPSAIDQRRVLGVVPGKPIAGERKDPANDDMVMVWPHLLVRHAVAALATMLSLYERDAQGGAGQMIDLALYEAKQKGRGQYRLPSAASAVHRYRWSRRSRASRR